MRNLDGTQYEVLRLKIYEMPEGMHFGPQGSPSKMRYLSLGGGNYRNLSGGMVFSVGLWEIQYPVDLLTGRTLSGS